MKLHRLLSLAMVIAFVMVPLASKATPACPTDSLGNVIALGSCMIGSSTFTFGPAQLASIPIYYPGLYAGDSVYAPSASLVTFTPIVSSSSPGFTLSGAFGVIGSPSKYNPNKGTYQVGNYMDAQLGYFSVDAPSGSSIAGTSIAMAGANISTAAGDSSNYAMTSLNSLYAYTSGDGTSLLSNTDVYGPGPKFTGVINLRAYDYSSDPTSVAGFTGASFNFELASDTQPTLSSVPEPATYAILIPALGLLGFMGRRRKQKEAA